MPRTRATGGATGAGEQAIVGSPTEPLAAEESPSGAQAPVETPVPATPRGPRASKPASTHADVDATIAALADTAAGTALAAAVAPALAAPALAEPQDGAAAEVVDVPAQPASGGGRAELGGVADGARRSGRSLARGFRGHIGVFVSIVVAGLALAAASALGPVDQSNAVLVGLGFDPDRAQLLTALIIGGAIALLACIAGEVRWAAVTLGFGSSAALFGPTFVRETKDALSASGATGAFDPLGWGQTVLALLVIGLMTAWACAVCAGPLRREAAAGIGATMAAARHRPLRHARWARPIGTILAICLLAGCLPVAGDLFNYGADTLMIAGGPPRQGLVPDNGGIAGGEMPSFPPLPPLPTESPSPVASLLASANPSAALPSATTAPTSNVVPWESSPPTGPSRLVYLAFKGPWAGSALSSDVGVYIPAGYDANDSRHYPVIYEAPSSFALWNSAIRVETTLDSMINTGEIPPSLFVFMDGGGGPYPDSECADSFDRVEKMDHYMAVSVPEYIDAHYRTIPTPAARAIIGMSQGGYCAASLALRHPDVFGSAAVFSGYFEAGVGAASAKYVFGGNPTVIADFSPSYIAPQLPASAKSSLYLVIVAQREQVFYGGEASTFVGILDSEGIANAFINADEPHGWSQVRDYLDRALVLVARRQLALGVFNNPAASPSPSS